MKLLQKRQLLTALYCIANAQLLPAAAPDWRPVDLSSDRLSRPRLVLESGRHSERITQISTDDKQQFLLSMSWDGTARVWDLTSRTLFRTIWAKPPADGAWYNYKPPAGAISPDGKTVAVSGTYGTISIYDRASGTLQETITLKSEVHRLAYERKGKFLLVVHYCGVSVIRLDDYEAITLRGSSDPKQKPSTTSWDGEFSKDGRLVIGVAKIEENGKLIPGSATVCLYDSQFSLVKEVPTPSGELAFPIRFSPDGKKIAVGQFEAGKVAILSANDLSNLATLTLTGETLDFAWSNDSSVFYGVRGTAGIMTWSNLSDDARLEVKTDKALRRIIPISHGLIAVSHHDIGIVTHSGNYEQLVPEVTVDLQMNPIIASDDGNQIGIKPAAQAKGMFTYRASDRTITLHAANDSVPALSGPVTIGVNVAIPDASNKGQWLVKLAGKPLDWRLDKPLCYAVAPDLKSFVVGGQGGFVRFLSDGRVTGGTFGGEVLSTNITAKGILLVGYSSGQVSWFRAADLAPLLNFFIHPDGKAWAAWTPEGYYDCSPDGERFITWQRYAFQVPPEVEPASAYRDKFYSPQRVKEALTANPPVRTGGLPKMLDIESQLRQNRKKAGTVELLIHQPPEVKLLSPADKDEAYGSSLAVRYSVKAQSEDSVMSVEIAVDGKTVKSVEDEIRVQDGEVTREELVSVPSRDCKVTVVAKTAFRSSTEKIARVKWKGNPPPFTSKPSLYVLAVGVRTYPLAPALNTLQFPPKDAADFETAILTQKGKLYKDVIVESLPETLATRPKIIQKLAWLKSETTQDDVAMIFLSGHATNDDSNNYYFQGYDYDKDNLPATGVSSFDFERILKPMAGKAIVFADTCRSGNISQGGTEKGDGDIDFLAMKLKATGKAVVIISGSTSDGVSREREDWQNGAFTKALVEGLNGKASEDDGSITVTSLFEYIKKRVKELTDGTQTPTITIPKSVPDFTIAVGQKKDNH